MFHSMRSKILAAVIGVTILAGLFITVLFYWKSSKMIEENYKENLYARIEQTGEAFDHSLSEIYHMTVQAACDEKLLEKMETYLAGEEETQLEELSQMLREYETQCTDITSVYLVFPQKQMIITSKEYPIYEKKVAQWKLNEIEKLSQNAITPAMIQNPIGKKSDILSFVNSIEDSTGNTIAYIMSNMEEQVLYYKYLDS
ncbi:MAG: sensor histidine kinase, partial [Lachnospiraceae bacterium]